MLTVYCQEKTFYYSIAGFEWKLSFGLEFLSTPGGKMQSVTSSSSSSAFAPQKASHHDDELFMKQRVLFSENLNELKNLRKQLYSAAEYFEMSYSKEAQKQLVVETLKDYVIKSVVNTVDHLGSMAYKVNGFLDEKVGQVSETELRVSCIERRLRTCQDYTDQGGLFQNSSYVKFPKHHRRYILPVGAAMDAVGQSAKIYRSSDDLFEIKTEATMRENSPTIISEEQYSLRSPQSSPGAFQFTRTASRHERRAVSPQQFPLVRCGSLAKKSTSMNSYPSAIRYLSEPRTRRSASFSLHSERDRARDTEQQSGKNKRLYKTFLSMGKSRKDATLYKYLDQN